MSCPLLDPPSNGVIDCTSNEVGGTCTLTCDDGHELTGSASRTCQDNGTWSGTDAICTPGWLHADFYVLYVITMCKLYKLQFKHGPQ